MRSACNSESAGAASAKFDGILASLTEFTDKQLEQLTKRAHVIMDGRKRTFAGSDCQLKNAGVEWTQAALLNVET